MIHVKREFSAKEVVLKFRDAIDHAKNFTLCGGVILFCCRESSARVVDGAIPVRKGFLH